MLFLLSSTLCYAQYSQYSEESEVTASRIPQIIKKQIQPNFPKEDVRWFLEYQNDGISYYARFNVQKQLLSIKFNSEGSYYDVEVPTKWKDLHSSTQESFNTYFEENFEKYKIRKIYLQYKQQLPEVASYFYNFTPELTPSYVLEYIVKDQGRILYLGEFNTTGEFISKQKLTIPEADYRHFDN